MKYAEMKDQAILFNEMLKIHADKPKLIAESERKISKLKQEIEGFNNDNTQEILGKLSPKKFSFRKKKPVDIHELILKKEAEIRKEEINADVLYEANTIDLIDIDEVVREVNAILVKNGKEVEEIARNVVKARDEYHRLLDEYKGESDIHGSFERIARDQVLKIRKEAYIPQYHNDNAYVTYGERVISTTSNYDVISGHRQRALSPQTWLLPGRA